MIFNRDNKGNRELRELTGNYYANNDFGKMPGFIQSSADELKEIITPEVYALAESAYTSGDASDLVRRVQLPIAIMATLRMYQRNDLSHEDSGRKFKIDAENEKLPWQWQLDRDDEMHLEDYYKSVDALIRFLNDSDIQEWKDSPVYQKSQEMLIKNGRQFDDYFSIDKSERTFLLLLPIMREVQILHTKKNFGAGRWDELMIDAGSDAYFAACKGTALLTMSIALKRMQLSVIPAGVIRRYMSENGAASSKAATLRDIKQVAEWLEEDGKEWINEMKRARDGGSIDYQLLPDNHRKNKYFRL